MSDFYSSKLNSFGTASIPKLVLQFSVPSIISMMVNALYNIVDRFFVGQGVGSLGIAGITLCFPITLFIMAMSMMIGVGGNTLFAIRLGQKKYIQASIILNNSFSLLLLMAAGTFTLGEIFMEPLLKLFGASDQTLPVASSYMRILLCGAFFQTVAPGMNHFIRSMGHPKTASSRLALHHEVPLGHRGRRMGDHLLAAGVGIAHHAVLRKEGDSHTHPLAPYEVALCLCEEDYHPRHSAFNNAGL